MSWSFSVSKEEYFMIFFRAHSKRRVILRILGGGGSRTVQNIFKCKMKWQTMLRINLAKNGYSLSYLALCYSKWGSRTSGIGFTSGQGWGRGALLEMLKPWSHLRPTKLESAFLTRSAGDSGNITVWDHWCRTFGYGNFSWFVLCCPWGCIFGAGTVKSKSFRFLVPMSEDEKKNPKKFGDHFSILFYVKSYARLNVHNFGFYSLDCYWRRIWLVIDRIPSQVSFLF